MQAHAPNASAGVRPAGGSLETAEECPLVRHDLPAVQRDKFSSQLLADASAVFSRRLGRVVSDEEARALLGNLADYFALASDHAKPVKGAKPRPEGKDE